MTMEKTEMTLQEAPKVSLIVPMYMCEAYVPELMAMLCGQDLREIEIICVIDGSPDRTRELVEKYAAGDSRIRVIVQDHGGAGKARNTGMAAARGKYLMFPDADDVFEPNYISVMYQSAEQFGADVVVCHYRQMDSKTNITYYSKGYYSTKVPVNRKFRPEDIKNLYVSFTGGPWNKIFNKGLVDKYQLRFSESHSSNDIFFISAMLSCASGIAAIPDHLYTYRMNINKYSISSNRNLTDFLIAFDDLFHWLHQWNLWKLNSDNFIRYWRKNFHYQARFSYDENYAKKIAEHIFLTEPWVKIDDRGLYRQLRLDLSIQRLAALLILVRKHIKKFLNKPADGVNNLLQMQKNEIQNIADVKKELTEVYGKHMNYHDNLIRSFIWIVQDEGLSTFIYTISQRLNALMKIR